MEYAEQIRLKTLLKDDVYYRAWFLKPPKLRVVHHTLPWRLFIQKEKDGRWAKVDLPSYAKALAAVRLKLPEVWDISVHCKPQSSNPPVLKISGKKVYNPIPEGHEWCGYCRRPTVFKVFGRHPNHKYRSEPSMRCTICGVRLEFLKRLSISHNWPLLAVDRLR